MAEWRKIQSQAGDEAAIVLLLLLDIHWFGSMFRATFGKTLTFMRNIITKLLIVVVPGHIALGG